MRAFYGLHKQGLALLRGLSSATLLSTATASYYGAMTYGVVNWAGVTAGATFRIIEVDGSATATLSNTVWIGFCAASFGSAFVNLGDEGLKASSVGTSFKAVTDTLGTVNMAFIGFHTPTNA